MSKVSKRSRLGLCTGGGDCPGLNAVIHAVVRHATMTHGMEVIGIRNGLTGLVEEPPAIMPLDLANVAGIHDRGGTILGTNNKGSPFRKKDQAETTKRRLIAAWKALGFDAMIVIGGDGTHLMARHLHEAGLPLVGVPKTIDNDLRGSELTVGFPTVVEVAADAAHRLATSAEAHDRIMILEVMGRNAGHIAIHTAIASAASIALIPEIPFSYDVLEARVRERQAAGRNSMLIIAAEGAYPKGEQPVFKAAAGTKKLGGIGEQIAAALHERTGVDVRVAVLGHIQRGGAPNAHDRVLASMMGARAVDLVAAKRFGRVVVIRNGVLGEISYAKIEDGRRLLALDSDIVATAEAMGLCLGRETKAHRRR